MTQQSYSRRGFMRLALASMVGAGMGRQVLAAEEGPRWPEGFSDFGIILNTVGREMKADHEGTLRKLAEMGYKYIETGRHFGESVESFLRLLDSLGLKVIAGGSAMRALIDNPDRLIANALALRARYLVCYWPWLTGAENLTAAEVLQSAENCNAIGEKCKAAGLRFAVHNHAQEFQDIGGRTVLDLLLERTQRDLVTVQLDVYWAAKGGVDPAAVIRRYPGRIELLHAKDMDHTPEQGMTAVGSGRLDFRQILIEAAKAGTRHVIVEHDRPDDGIQCARDGIRHLKGLIA